MKRYFCLMALVAYALTACLCRGECTIEIPSGLLDVKLCETTPRAILLTSSKTWGKGVIHVIDENSGNELWSKKINYTKEFADIECDKYVMIKKPGSVSFYDIDSGTEVINLDINPACIYENRDFIIGSHGSKGKKMEAFRLSTGEKLWESKLNGGMQGRWQIVDVDTVSGKVILQGKNLCSVQYNTGAINDYVLKTSVSDKAAIGMFVGASLVGGVLGVMSGVGYVPVGAGGDFSIGGLCSNIICDSDKYYIADKNHLVCVDSDMNPVWTSPISDNMGSRSRLYCDADTLFMINFGIGYRGDGSRRYTGRPFYAAFDKSTGGQFYCNMWPDKWDKSLFGKKLDWVTEPVYALDKEGAWFSPVVGYGGYNPIYGDNQLVYMVNGDLEIVDSFHIEDLYMQMEKCGDCFLLRQIAENPAYYLVSHTGAVIYRFPDECSWVFADGRKLCTLVDDKLVFTDVDSIQNLSEPIQPGQLVAYDK